MATEHLGLAENALTNTNRVNIVENFNENMGIIDAALGDLEYEECPCVMSGVGVQPTNVTVWRIGKTGFAAGYVTTPRGGNDQTVASATGIQPAGESDEAIQFAASTAEQGKSAAGILHRTETGFDVRFMASHAGTYRFSVAFPCLTVG